MSEGLCPLCRDNIEGNYKKLPKCSCSLKLHQNCYDQFIENGFGCPICPESKKYISKNVGHVNWIRIIELIFTLSFVCIIFCSLILMCIHLINICKCITKYISNKYIYIVCVIILFLIYNWIKKIILSR